MEILDVHILEQVFLYGTQNSHHYAQRLLVIFWAITLLLLNSGMQNFPDV